MIKNDCFSANLFNLGDNTDDEEDDNNDRKKDLQKS